MVKNTKNAHQIFEFHKIWHILFNSQPILMNKSLELTYGVRLQFIFTNTVRFFASICHFRPRFNVFITGPVTTSLDPFFPVFSGPGPRFAGSGTFWNRSQLRSFQKRRKKRDQTSFKLIQISLACARHLLN